MKKLILFILLCSGLAHADTHFWCSAEGNSELNLDLRLSHNNAQAQINVIDSSGRNNYAANAICNQTDIQGWIECYSTSDEDRGGSYFISKELTEVGSCCGKVQAKDVVYDCSMARP
jgi:hypothetical protein